MKQTLSIFLAILTFCGVASARPEEQHILAKDLALRARATVSSEAEGTRADDLIDGDRKNTHWAAKDGSDPAETWVQLDWPGPLEFQEVLIRQEGDARLSHLELEIHDDATGQWRSLQSIGTSPQQQLPRNILAQFPPQRGDGLRLSHFEGPANLMPVSILEIEVYDRKDPSVVEMGSDLLNHIFGIVTDAFGTQPFPHVPVHLSGTIAGKPWQESAQTESNGTFLVTLPVGLDGAVTAVAQLPAGATAQQTLPASDFSSGLNAIDDSARSVALDGTWRFKCDPSADFYQPNFPDSSWKEIQVPSHWVMQGFDANAATAGYRRHLRIPESFRGRRIKLSFAGVYSTAEIWFNGRRVGGHDGGFSAFELDVTDTARAGADNLLAVLARANSLSSHFDNMSYYANFPLAGIFRSVKLFSLPEAHVRRFHVQTSFDSQFHDAKLTVDLSVENESAQPVTRASLVFSLEDPRGQSVSLPDNELEINLPPWSRIEKRVTLRISAPEHWEAEHPHLYTLRAKLSGGRHAGETGETVSRSVGFRQVDVRGTQLLVNGVPVKFRGVNHFEADPLTGRVASEQLTRTDLELMRETNLDAIRTSAFPAIEALYDEADKLGFYIEEEGPFCWVDESADLRYMPLFVQRTAEMLDRDRSHPSVIYWSIDNESNWGPDFEAAHRFARQSDPTRPNSAGQSQQLELATMHNPISLARMQEREDVKVPIIWDESLCIFQGDIWGDTKEMWLDPGDRDYYIAPLIPIWDAVQSSANVQGGMIWAWVDDIFLVPGRDSEYGRGSLVQPLHALDGIYHEPGRGIVGDAPWGIVDGWRRKKPEFWHVKMLMSPVHLEQSDLPAWKPGSPAVFTVDNRYEFTNLSELAMEWSVGSQHGTLHPEIAPRATGKVSIPVGPETKGGDILSIQFLNASGQLIMPHEMRLGAAPRVYSGAAPNAPALRYVHEGSWLSGAIDRFLGQNFEITFDSATGRIRRALVDGHSVLYQSPKLHVLPIESTESEFPAFDSWRLTKPIEVRALGRDYEIVEAGSYRDFAGELRFRITPEGDLRVSYDFTFTGSDTRAREIGLQVGLPLWCDRLQWKRLGEWTVYPADHIGRNEGIAMAHASGPQTVPPTQAFALDDTPLGTNDFRSTKRDFIFATLTDPQGYGLGIAAIGTQHLRAMVDSDQIQLNINDWFGGTAAVASGEWWANYGLGRDIRPDDPTQGAAQNKVSGAIQLHLLSPNNAPEWLRRVSSIAAPRN